MNTERSNIAAGLLALLIGGIGVHKFYNGSWGWGLVYIVMCWSGIPAIAALIEGILYLTNENGYNRDYNQTPPDPWKW